ncbi:ngg1 interacting factor 3-like protein [Vairimorpha apis BRL 01]|uniref:Ngg1 interacting factor 3-like protein n=1 Tax=Vairimorpha apis BRL 01 TaxID=1037528 RepID=T0LB69_9MICR|nr:ngg1 interacting factor 3-like protein [Vairimorpha apis BRL 01]
MSIYEIYNKINEVLPLNQSLEWDNTGILVNSGFDSKNVLLTIDITEKVIEECKIKNIGNIIAYHPILFTVAMYTCDVPKYMVVGVGSAFKYHTFFDSVIITGEMSHHCLLHSLQNRNTVILLEHSNSERIVLPYIKTILQKILPEYKIFISDADSDPINFY